MASGQVIDNPLRGKVLISEIMADPSPPVGLPAREYIELFNNSANDMSLDGWKLLSGDTWVPFPGAVIKSSGRIIVCHENYASEFSAYGSCAGLKQFPALTDGGRLLCLFDRDGKLIHGVEYSDKWYGDLLRSGGGWSLEIIDPDYPFSGKDNWRASRAQAGGTPGAVNSVDGFNPDKHFGGLYNVFPTGRGTLEVSFTEPVFFPGTGADLLSAANLDLISLQGIDFLRKKFLVESRTDLQCGSEYILVLTNSVTDFAGNRAERGSFSFGFPERPSSGDVRFNELLFNPEGDKPDYFELVNVSGKTIDASSLYVVSVNGSGDTSRLYQLSAEGRCLMPGAYYAVTTDCSALTAAFSSSDPYCIFELPSIPSMNNDEGHLILYTRDLELIDEVHYRESMHFSLLSGYEGIALEKSGPKNPSDDPSSWHSASESSGWGTPGRRNSIYPVSEAATGTVTLSSTKISPDGDGFEDFLSVHVSFPGLDNVVSVFVFDETGSLVRRAAENMLACNEADVVWDGTANDGSAVNTGIYIILVSSFDDKGKTGRWKRVCTVIRNR
ncbi:MAG: lamin tail domain-containing protein [Bacteroidales bacterium]|nr:lamin tail domain-containing protein [Bacteroidales bacterium]